MIKKFVCVSSERITNLLPVSIIFKKILFLYSLIIGLRTFCRENISYIVNQSSYYVISDNYKEKKNTQNQNSWSVISAWCHKVRSRPELSRFDLPFK